jgi:outer membrane protein
VDTLKTQTEGQKPGGGPQAMLPWLLGVLVLALLGLGLLFKAGKVGTSGNVEGAAQVATLDADQIHGLPEFLQARKDLEKMSQEAQEKLIKEVQSKKLPPEEAEQMRLQYLHQLEEDQNKKMRPLNNRVEAAIASLAQERHLRVVLDKKVVLVGVSDITADVKTRFEQTKDAQPPKETTPPPASVGYVNQEVITQLKIYKEAQARVDDDYQKELRSLQKQAKGKSEAQLRAMQGKLQQDMMARQVEYFKPVKERVDEVIREVAKEKGLALVLSNVHVLWGGRNLTDDVVKKLVDRSASKS